MRTTRRLLLLTAALPLLAKPADDFVCPMDPEVHRTTAGRCPRCGMALVAKLPSFAEYPVVLTVQPRVPQPNHPVTLRFQVQKPETGEPCVDFAEIHEKLYHLFLVSEDLEYFAHEHPVRQADGVFELTKVLPKAGLYRILSDFYPVGGQPQMVASTLLLPGGSSAPLAVLAPNLTPKQGTNTKVTLAMEPAQPIAGKETLLFFRLDPGTRLEPYLGAWGHLLAASGDLIDMIHTHPTIAEGGPEVQFNLIFPRPGLYRLWLQLQRAGTVNTLQFTVPVQAL